MVDDGAAVKEDESSNESSYNFNYQASTHENLTCYEPGWNEPFTKLVVHRLIVEDPPAAAVHLLTVILEVHVVVEAYFPETHVFELVQRHWPGLNPVRTAERYCQTHQCKHATPKSQPRQFTGWCRLLFNGTSIC